MDRQTVPNIKTDARKTVKAFGDAVDHLYMYYDSAGTIQIVVEFNEKYDSNLRNILVDEVLKMVRATLCT